VLLRTAEPRDDERVAGSEWCCSGTNGAGGAFSAATSTPAERGSAGAISRTSRSMSPPWSRSQKKNPRSTIGSTSCRRNSNDVTTPKLPPPPRIAQNRVRVLLRGRAHQPPVGQHHVRADEVVQREPVPVGQPAEATAEREPGDPGVADRPAGNREPVLLRGGVDLGQRATRPQTAVFATGSTTTEFIRLRSIISPSSRQDAPLELCPPPLIASSRPLPAPKRTAAATSAADSQRAMSRGRRSIMPFHKDLAPS